MSVAITFLSGKGGSGKTTLALSIADLLGRCSVKTLLVDCDLSTNGATYFYESQLHEQNKSSVRKISSFQDILYRSEYINDIFPFNIKPNLDFIPSVSEISSQFFTGERMQSPDSLAYILTDFRNWARKKYDVILFDCQAGYSEFLPHLLILADVDLFVLEADSISASSMRSLHLKVGNSLGHARLYQVFNKATPDEFDIYSKIVGTFFTNIGTLLFDWKIRQAFSRSQVPDFEKTSVQYGLDLCEICKIIFAEKTIHKKIVQFSAKLLDTKLEEAEDDIRSKLEELNRQSYKKITTPLIQFLLLFLMLSMCLALYITGGHTFGTFEPWIVATGLLLSTELGITLMLNTNSSSRERRYQRTLYQKQLQKLNEKRLALKAGIVLSDS